jgi:hypothetical protein
MRCRSGMVLRTPAGAQPRYDDPFVIVDERLTVKAVSRQAEVVLLVDEPAAVGVSLQEFLSADNGKAGGDELPGLIQFALAGGEPSAGVPLATVGDPEIPLVARVSSCGPPSGAVVVLKPQAPTTEQTQP